MLEPFLNGFEKFTSTGTCHHSYLAKPTPGKGVVKQMKQCTNKTHKLCCGMHKQYERTYLGWKENFINSLSGGINIPSDYYEINGDSNCDGYGCDGICRCYSIESVNFTKGTCMEVNMGIADNILWSITPLSQWLGAITQHIDQKQVALVAYYLNRLTSIMIREGVVNGTYEYLLEPSWTGGYYGDEFTGFSTAIPDLIKSKLSNKFVLSDLLELEYHVKENVTLMDIVDVHITDINIPNPVHFQKCLQEDLYPEYTGIIAICTPLGSKYTLKDGYHRLASAKLRGDAVVKVIVAKWEQDDLVSS